MKLKGKVAIVTGGVMGIGLGIVRVFLKYGAKVIILDYSDKLDNVVSQIKSQNFEIEGYNVDVRDDLKVKSIVAEVANKYGQIDVLVNNAGTIRLTNFIETSEEERDVQFDINIKGVWNVTQAVLSYMKENSAIVNLSSVTGPLVADPGEVAYATSKSAIQGFTKGLAAEVVGRKIRVNAIQPGYILTPLANEVFVASDPTNPEAVRQMLADSIPMKRLGDPTEVGELAAFLASSESSYITGQAIVIDGGSTMPETPSVGV